VKKRHHYVPRFYLRRFASQPRRINVFNLRRRAAFASVGLRDQCFKHRLYGHTPLLEDAFSILETQIPKVFDVIEFSHQPPQRHTADYERLVRFLALQYARTTAAVSRIRRSSSNFAAAAFKGSPPAPFQVDDRQALALSLATLPHIIESLSDLPLHLIQAPSGTSFVTSDNPVFRYNTYCEGIKDQGVIGTLCRGLQLFLPISPRSCLLFYDSAVYKAGPKGAAQTSVGTADDVRMINLMQLLSAQENVYFAQWQFLTALESLADTAMNRRREMGPHLNEAVEEGNDRSVLIHSYERMPDLHLRLSFLSVRRHARRVPLLERARSWRTSLADLTPPSVEPNAGGSRIFRLTRRR